MTRPNRKKLLGIVRHLLTGLGGAAVAAGYVDEGTATELVGAVMTIAGFAASYLAPEKAD